VTMISDNVINARVGGLMFP